MPKEKETGEWYAPKEVVKVMQKTLASEALINLAEDYLRKARGSSIAETTEADKNILFEKATTAAMKAVAIDTHPLNFYKAGVILEKTNKIDQAKIFFRTFLIAAPNLISEGGENFKVVVQNAINDVKSKSID